MRQFCGTFMTKLKEYERRHPILIIIWSVLITALLVAGVMVGVSFRHNTAKEGEYIVFNNKYIEKELQQILKKDKITQEDLDSLRTIDIEDNQEITEIADLAKCKKLIQLTIKNCKLNDISAIEGLNELQVLDLSGNEIKDITALSKCYSLTELTLTNNQISDISPIYGLEKIQKLVIQQNNIGNIQEGIEKMKSLTFLDLSKNRLVNINQLGKIEQLNFLYASSNMLSETPDLGGLTNLILLDLGNNAFSKLGYLGNLEQLEELDIYSNHLEDFDVLRSCPNIKRLNISYNEYSGLNGIEQCPDLELLSMKGTMITDISVLENLHNFNTIYLDNDFDRSQIDFMIGNFKNGDEKTKQYLLDKQYNLND